MAPNSMPSWFVKAKSWADAVPDSDSGTIPYESLVWLLQMDQTISLYPPRRPVLVETAAQHISQDLLDCSPRQSSNCVNFCLFNM